MKAVLASITALLLAVFLLALGAGLLGTLLSVRLAQAGANALTAGWVMSAYFIGLFAGSMVMQRWIVSVGYIRTYSAFTAILSAASLLHPFGLSPLLWAVLRLAEGFCMAGLLLCVESWLNVRSTRESRGQVLALYMIVFYAANGFGQLLLAMDQHGFGLFAIASVMISIAAVPVALTKVEAPVAVSTPNFSVARLYGISPTGIVGSLMSGLVVGAFYALAPFFAIAVGLSSSQTAAFMGAAVFGGLIMQWPIGRLSDRFDRRRVIVAVNLAVAVVAVCISLLHAGHFYVLLLLVALFGGLSFTLYPLSVANANDNVDSTEVVATGRGLLLAYSVGAFLGPLFSATVMYSFSASAMFVLEATVCTLVALYVWWRISQKAPVPEDQRAPYQVVPRMTPEAVEMDPRGT
ncbi:MAG: MFS transporter [Alphaproteobacteria bacterium]|nr:MFS transporter [Alphaproteobacteria bacterium]